MTPPRILHPQAIPVAGIDAHLPPVPAARLTPAALRRRFAAPGTWTPEFAGDGRPTDDRPSAAAAVLVAIVEREAGATVLLTRRAEHLRDHAGQISFPGGRVEPGDADAAATALREAEEEVGLARARVDVIGHLPPYTTVTHFVVTPVVAIVTPPFELQIDAFEVAAAFEVPLAFLMDPANHRRHVFEAGGARRQFLSMPWGDHFIWGATAAMLRNLYGFLAED
ncbi:MULTISPECIES: CoA pyrophosphatase [unclassified Rubrivivax]|uniref:CoA pyrophosphatase n=1 Tax=unclassified Rubrivivax TaxID=2649762 RepID=UPI001E2C1620|nr:MULTISPECIES: CoA pyrophosphatase [unclassified Rubrivivax]MCC9595836.1 CoA pyrophosphatase [Rubrivivax sp. JA1055]MCC9647824.1 CoA pyrophosphatase [Rubrivivax sp. JA1029]